MTGDGILNVCGAFSQDGVVSRNDVIIQGGSIVNGDVYGGYSGAENVVLNAVEIADSTVNGNVTGGRSGDGTAESNGVILAGGTVTGDVVGGYGEAGAATGNSIFLLPGADGKATTFGKDSGLYGGLGAVASDNSLTLVGVKGVKVVDVGGFDKYQFNLAPDTKAGDTLLAATDRVAFSDGGSMVDVDFSGSPIWDFGLSEDNKKINLLTLKNGKFNGTPSLATGTYTLNGILSNYTGKLNADTNNVFVELEEKPLEGGPEYVKVVGKNGNASGNTVVVPPSKDGATVPNAIAALASSKDDKTELTGNSVTVSEYGIVEGRAVGAASYAGDVRENTVNVNGHVVGFVAGGLTATGTADSNTVALVGNEDSTAANVDGNAYGGFSLAGTAKGNQMTMESKAAVKGDAYGGYGGKESSNNNLTMAGASQVRGDAYGGYAMKGAASGNTLTVTSSGKVTGDAYGGCAMKGAASGNTLTVTSSGKVTGDAYGGYATKGTASKNTLAVSEGASVDGSAYGGYGKTSATDNDVTISGGTITGKVIGGASPNTAKDNKIILAQGAAAASLDSATLYGSVRNIGDDSLPTTHSGNTLTVDGEKGITLATVKNFDVYDFKLGDVENGNVILNLTNDTDLGTAKVKVEDASAITGKSKIYLMKLEDGKTLAFTAGDGTTNISEVTQNDAKTATLTKTRKVAQEGNNLLLVDNIAYAFTLTPTVKNEDTLLILSDTGTTEIDKGDVTVKTSGVLRNLKQDDKVYLLKKTNGTLTATDVTYFVKLPAIYGTIRGIVTEDASNNALVLNVTDAESLTDNPEDYKYIVIVEGDTKNTGNEVTVGAGELADRSAIAALAKNETDATELTGNTLIVNGTVVDRAVGANSVKRQCHEESCHHQRWRDRG